MEECAFEKLSEVKEGIVVELATAQDAIRAFSLRQRRQAAAWDAAHGFVEFWSGGLINDYRRAHKAMGQGPMEVMQIPVEDGIEKNIRAKQGTGIVKCS